MSGDHLWPILFGISLAVNVILLLYRPVLAWLRRDKGEELADEIMAMVEEGEESGAIEQNEKELIANIFEFNSMTADDVMRHRTDMVTLALDDDDQTILDTIQSSGLSRFPVYKDDIDDIVGILSARDYLINKSKPDPLPLEQLLRPAYFVPESVRADVLFRDMQNRKIHMALVVDEYGGTGGLLTLEDLLEELVGKIYDEFDPQEEQEIIQLSDKQWKVSGSADLEDLAQAMDVELDEEELENLLVENSDEPYADRIAKAVIQVFRRGGTVDPTRQLYALIEGALSFLPAGERKEAVKKSCQRTFQALRIDVNSEFEVLYAFLDKLPHVLKPGGRAAILTFHSGEDRLVKQAFRQQYREGLYSDIAQEVTRPSPQECRRNPRAHSTKLRWAIRAK